MAQRTRILLIDDVDATDASETVKFGLDGVTYEIDLSDANSSRLRDDLAPWLAAARRSGGRKSSGRASSSRPQHLAQVRSWARENGLEVSGRGRVAASVQSAYDKAHA